VQWVDANTAVVVYTWTGLGTWQGQKLPAKTYASTVWTKKADRWVAVYHQESAAVAPPTPKPSPAKKQ
jgi:ketosteroid isomerase-like protein